MGSQFFAMIEDGNKNGDPGPFFLAYYLSVWTSAISAFIGLILFVKWVWTS